MVQRYIFGNTNTYYPRYPILGFHTNEYCELYVKRAIYEFSPILDYEKVRYLLRPADKDDKSLFFKLLGYNNDEIGKKELFFEIMKNSDFSRMKFQKLNQYGLFVKVPTNIYNKKKRIYMGITTIWKYLEDKNFYFVTAIPKKMED